MDGRGGEVDKKPAASPAALALDARCQTGWEIGKNRQFYILSRRPQNKPVRFEFVGLLGGDLDLVRVPSCKFSELAWMGQVPGENTGLDNGYFVSELQIDRMRVIRANNPRLRPARQWLGSDDQSLLVDCFLDLDVGQDHGWPTGLGVEGTGSSWLDRTVTKF